jgi:hypothetical protein
MDELLSQLDYPSLEAARRGNLGALLGLKKASQRSSTGLEDLPRRVLELLSRPNGAPARSGDRPFPPMEIVLQGAGGEEAVIFVNAEGEATLDGPVGDDTAQAPRARVRCEGDVLLQIAAGKVNLAQAAHVGQVSFEQEAAAEPVARFKVRELMLALGALFRPDSDGA